MSNGSAGDDAQVLQVMVHYQFEGRVHELVFGGKDGLAIPCSMYFDAREMERAREALGENSMTLLPADEEWGNRTPPGVTHSVLDRKAAETLGLRPRPTAWPDGGPSGFKVCWHSCMCHWWCLAP